MKRYYFPVFVVVLFVAGIFNCEAQQGISEEIVITNPAAPTLYGEHISFYIDSSATKSFDEVLQTDDFIPSNSRVPNLGVTDAVIWLKINLLNYSRFDDLVLEVENPLLDKVSFYHPDGKGGYQAKEISKNKPFTDRGNPSQNYRFEFRNVDSSGTTAFLRIESNTQLLIPVKIGSPEKVANANLNRDMLSGMYFGIMLVMLLYNLFVLLSTKDKSYFYYILYIFSVALVQLNITGLGFKYLWPHQPGFEKFSVFLFPSFTAFASIAFIRQFLNTKEFTPRLHKGFWVFVVAYCITIGNAIFGSKHLSYNLLNVNALPLSLYMIGIAAYIRAKYKYRPASFFLVAWSVFLVSIILFVMKDVGVLPYNLLTVSVIQIGSAFVVVLLSIALADKINIYKKEKEESQAQALTALEENARIIREQNVILETKVTERTVELQQSNEELNKTLKELKEAETQLVESEKMASLGQLTAGIAHEINNPINFVTSNVKPLKRDVDMIIGMLNSVEEISMSEASTDEKKQQIKALKEDLDYDYLKEEISYLLNGITEGSNRTAEIVKGLRVFSRLDEDDLKLADINEGMNSTLVIVRNTLGSNIDIITNYGNLPLVECYPGKLNQVFLNIVSNGLQAIRSKYKDEKGGQLTITTSVAEDNSVRISIKDNGTGMDENTKKKVFEPFFTTKDVGEGTGLGMSIVYNTINKHNGKIEFESTLGEGTEFIITLPVKLVNVQIEEQVGQQ
ncbi:MAG TPA: 7TM diverse intracellular signaling domain-containing protein [Flavipsychrobacter sp.]